MKMNRQMRRSFQKKAEKEIVKQKIQFQNRETSMVSGDIHKNFDMNFLSVLLRNMTYYLYSIDVDVVINSSFKNLYNFWRNGNRSLSGTEVSRALNSVNPYYFVEKPKKYFINNSDEIFRYTSFLYISTVKYLFTIFNFDRSLQEKSETELSNLFSMIFRSSYFLIAENFLMYTFKIIDTCEDGLYYLSPLDDITKEQEYKKLKFIPMSDKENMFLGVNDSVEPEILDDFRILYNGVFDSIYQNKTYNVLKFLDSQTSKYSWNSFFNDCSETVFDKYNQVITKEFLINELKSFDVSDKLIYYIVSAPFTDYLYCRHSLYSYIGYCYSLDCSRILLKHKEDGITVLNQELKELKTMNRNVLKSIKKLEKEKEDYLIAQKKEQEKLESNCVNQDTVNKSELDSLQLIIDGLRTDVESYKTDFQKLVHKCEWQKNRIDELEHLLSYYETIESDMLSVQNENSVLMSQIDSLETLEEDYTEDTFDAELDAIKDEPIFFLGGVNNMMERFIKLFPNSEYVNISDDNCNFIVPSKYKYAVMYTRVLTHAHSRRLESIMGKENIIPLNILNTRLAVHVIYEHIMGQKNKKN